MSVLGKTAVIIGGDSGIGRALAHILVDDGVSVLITGMETAKIDETVGELTRDGGPNVIGMRCDVIHRSDVEAVADCAFASMGRVDLLANCAGVGFFGSIHDTTPGDWNWVMEVNVTGAYTCCSVFVPRMMEQDGKAQLLNVGSEQSFGVPAVGSTFAYTVSKHAIIGLSDALRRDHDPEKLQVSVLCPGPVSTEIWNAERNRQPEFGPAHEVRPAAEKLLKRYGMAPDAVARMAVDGIKAGDFYIITHDHIRDMIDDRYAETIAACEPSKSDVA